MHLKREQEISYLHSYFIATFRHFSYEDWPSHIVFKNRNISIGFVWTKILQVTSIHKPYTGSLYGYHWRAGSVHVLWLRLLESTPTSETEFIRCQREIPDRVSWRKWFSCEGLCVLCCSSNAEKKRFFNCWTPNEGHCLSLVVEFFSAWLSWKEAAVYTVWE